MNDGDIVVTYLLDPNSINCWIESTLSIAYVILSY